MKDVILNVEQMHWEPAVGYPEGVEQKVLSTGEGVVPKTLLLRLPPGFRMENHSHRYVEQHFVLDGQYESGGHKHLRGTFRVIPSESQHGPFTSETGAVVLVSWCGLID